MSLDEQAEHNRSGAGGGGASPCPLVTVVIPAYNRADVIGRAIESVQAQTHADWEIIVVDDASSDETASVARRYAEQDPRVRVLSNNRRKGAQGARNTGIFAARGLWIGFLDSDDYWLPRSLALRLDAARETGAQVVHSAGMVVWQGAAEPRCYPRPELHGRAFKALLQQGGPMFQSLLVRREALERISGVDEAIIAFQEWDTAIRLSRYFDFAYVDEQTFVYDHRLPNSISKDLSRKARAYEQIITKHAGSTIRQLGPRTLGRLFRTAAQRYRDIGQKRQAWRCILKSLLSWPFQFRTLRSLFRETVCRQEAKPLR